MRKPIEKLEDRLRHAIDQRRVLEDKHVRREIFRALDEYLKHEHDFSIGWVACLEYKPEEGMVR